MQRAEERIRAAKKKRLDVLGAHALGTSISRVSFFNSQEGYSEVRWRKQSLKGVREMSDSMLGGAGIFLDQPGLG